jgi:exopolyphosphatase/guanosine-5'-triphosphate,3'-diphosphate pyrophosphatase
MRLAAIDIGTNSVHMIVVRVRPDASFEVIDREKEMVRLGAGGLDGRPLTEAAMTAALQALTKFVHLARSRQVDDILAVATSATREAANGGDFLAAVEEATGVRPQVITGTDEARLIHMAAAYGVGLRQSAVVIDIGGGSVEISLGRGGEVQSAHSFKIGVLRLTERFVTSDPLSGSDERRMVRHIGAQVNRCVQDIRRAGFDAVVGTSGTILSLGTVAAALDRGSVPAETRSLRVPRASLHRLRTLVTAMDLEARLRLPGLDPRRADLLAAGAVLLDTLVSKLKADELTLCDLALREGLVLDYIRQHGSDIVRAERYPDVRRRSAIELAERCGWDGEHARRVAGMALTLFDRLTALHGLGRREREWLEYAALLHDIGMHISYERHHRHSCYLIRNGDLRGFEPDEIAVIALVARYHRRSRPARSHEGYGTLPGRVRRTVRLLSAMLRIAETLDRSRHGVVRRLVVGAGARGVRIELFASGDCELEVWAATRQLPVLEAALRAPVLLVAHRVQGTRAPQRRRMPAPTRRERLSR